MKLRIGRGEVDQVVGVRENGVELAALRVPEKGGDLGTLERTREPLHVVLHEDLHRRALDRARALNRAMHAPANRHMRAEEDLRFHV